MATNLYDLAYGLQKGVKDSVEFTDLKKRFDDVESDPEAKKLFEEFRAIQMEMQQKMMQGQQITEADNAQAQQLVGKVQQNIKIAALMQAEQRMNVVITDLNKIIMQPLEEIYK